MHVVIRTEINESVAAGHAMRCISLGQALSQRGARVTIVCEDNALVRDLTAAAGLEYSPLPAGAPPADGPDADRVLALAPSVVVADSPKLGQPWINRIQASDCRVLALAGPPGPGPLKADGWLWPEACPAADMFSPPDGAQFHCGLDWVILSPTYWPRDYRTRTGQVRTVLVTTGGADHYDLCSAAIRAMDALDCQRLHIKVVVGGFFTSQENLYRTAAVSRHQADCIPSPRGIKDLIDWADLVVSGGGGTLYEMASRGAPGIGIAIWPIQKPGVVSMSAAGAILPIHYASVDQTEAELRENLGRLLRDPALRKAQSEAGLTTIDALGAQRAAEWILSHSKGRPR